MTDIFSFNQDLIDKRKANERVEKKIGKIERVKESKIRSLEFKQEQQDTSRLISRNLLQSQNKERKEREISKYVESKDKADKERREKEYPAYEKEQKGKASNQALRNFREKLEPSERIGKGASKIGKSLYESMKKPMKYKTVMKKSKMTYKPREYVPDNTWNHENKFFKNELDNEKRSLYFS
jgi:hypothetical protein